MDNIQTVSEKVRVCFLTFDEMPIKRLTVLEALLTLEAMAEQAILHVMPWSSLSVVYVISGSNQWLLFDSWKHKGRDACYCLDGDS